MLDLFYLYIYYCNNKHLKFITKPLRMKKLLLHLALSMVLIPALVAQPQAWKSYYSKYSLSSIADNGNSVGFIQTNQLVQFDKASGYYSYQEIPINVLPCNSEHQPFQYIVTSFTADPAGNYWMTLGTEDLYGTAQPTVAGAFYEYDGTNWTSFTSTLANAGYDSLITPYFDNRGNMWFVSTQGLVRYNGSTFTTWDTLNTLLNEGLINTPLVFDTTGNLWLAASPLGVIKFDGTNVTIFDSAALGSASGSSNPFYVWGIYVNPVTNIVYTLNGYGNTYYQYNGTSWAAINISNFYFSATNNYVIYNVFFDLSGNTYFSLAEGILKYDGSTYTMLTNLPGYSATSTNYISYEHTDAAGQMWMIVNGQFAGFDGTNFTTYPDSRAVLENDIMVSEMLDNTGTLWLSYWGSGGMSTETNGVFTAPIKASDNYGPMYATTIDTLGQLWCAGTQIYRYISPDTMAVYQADGASGCELAGMVGITVDKSNNIWAIGYTIGACQGLAILGSGGDSLSFVGLNTANPEPIFTCIAADSSGNIWIGTADDPSLGSSQTGLLEFNGTNLIQYTTSNSGLPDNQVQSLGVGPDNRLWVGTYGHGVSVFNGNTWTVYDTANSGLPDNHVEWFYYNQGKVYIATQWNGFAVFDGDNWTAYTPENSPLVDEDCEALVVDAQCNVWAATECGLSELVGSCNQQANILFGTVRKEDGSPLAATPVNLLKFDSAANILRMIDNTFTDGSGNYVFSTEEADVYVQGVPNQNQYQFTMPGYQDSALVQQQPVPLHPTHAGMRADIECVASTNPNGNITLAGTIVKSTGGKAGALRIYLMQNNLPVATTVTQVNGNYRFTGIPAGNYTIWADKMGVNNAVAPAITLSTSAFYTAQLVLHDTYLELVATGIHAPVANMSFSLYPNPNAGAVLCNLQGAAYPSAALDLYSITGQRVYGQTLTTGANQLDLQQLPNGIYIAQLNTPTGTIQQKLVIQR